MPVPDRSKEIAADLNRWADILTQVPEGNFDIDYWYMGDEPLDPDQMDGSCGTVACAAGWATADPVFRKRGLRIAEQDGMFGNGVVCDGRWGEEAIAKCIGISYGEARRICLPTEYPGVTEHSSYPSPSSVKIVQVTDRILELAAKYEKQNSPAN